MLCHVLDKRYILERIGVEKYDRRHGSFRVMDK
jgi:hypothetical protein